LAFVRALQAQTCASLGRAEESAQYLNLLMQLLKRRRGELKTDDSRLVIQAMAVLMQGQDCEDAQNYAEALKAYKQALSLSQQDSKSNAAMVWAIQQKVNRANRKA
jgi:hypothetical protein